MLGPILQKTKHLKLFLINEENAYSIGKCEIKTSDYSVKIS